MNNCVVKIAVSSENDYYHIEDVVYYRSGMSPDFVSRWLWFFEYLAARVKVNNPRRRVELIKGSIDFKIGQEWHEYRRSSLIKSRTQKLKKLESCAVQADLFGFAQDDHEAKLDELRKQLALLERDEFFISDFPIYINKIKDYV